MENDFLQDNGRVRHVNFQSVLSGCADQYTASTHLIELNLVTGIASFMAKESSGELSIPSEMRTPANLNNLVNSGVAAQILCPAIHFQNFTTMNLPICFAFIACGQPKSVFWFSISVLDWRRHRIIQIIVPVLGSFFRINDWKLDLLTRGWVFLRSNWAEMPTAVVFVTDNRTKIQKRASA